jgi:hypothetical protein
MNNNRELIEEFLGKDHDLVRTIAAPDYEGSWSWIMPVYVKIVDSLERVKERDDILDVFFPVGVFYSPDGVYNACVAYIKHYNLTYKK